MADKPIKDMELKKSCLVCAKPIEKTGGCMHEMGYWHHIKCGIAPEVLDGYIKALFERVLKESVGKDDETHRPYLAVGIKDMDKNEEQARIQQFRANKLRHQILETALSKIKEM